ncbi:MAG: isochorismatase family protein [Candidatus Solibacter usitatus]|nr:isochorismatase family protein [Candidatus Solibacter usitatus]
MRIVLTVLLFLAAAAFPAAITEISLPLRSRVELYKGSGDWRETRLSQPLPLDRTAVVICDMWDKHWCRGATERAGKMVDRFNAVLGKLRERNVLIIHAPSETMEFYKEAPQRLAILGMPKAPPPTALNLADPELPVDSARGGCDTGDKNYKAWSRQHPALVIGPRDLISDKGDEVYSALKLRGVTHLLVMGVHTNMCILNRTFAIKQMTKWGMRCILIRDLTDAMYDPNDKPYVSHQAGTDLVIEHIEKHWAPTTTSAELLGALGK